MADELSRRTFLGAAAALGGGALLAACGGKSGSGTSASSGSGASASSAASRSSSASSGVSGDVVYNTFLDPSNTKDARAVAQTAAISAFEQANPKIKVHVNVDPPGANVQKAIAAGSDTPDVWRIINQSVPEFVKQGGLAPLDKYIDRDGMDRSDWLLPLSLNQVNGATYCLQQDYRIPVFLYRADAYKAAGVSTPPATFDDVINLASKLSATGKMWFPIGFGSSGGFVAGEAFLEFLGNSMLAEKSGGQLFAPDGVKPAFDQAAVEAMATMIKELYASKASTKSAANWGYTEYQQALQTGTASSATFGLYRYTSLKSSGAGDLAWAAPPAFDAAGKQPVGGQTISINNASKNKDAAWEFVKFMTSPDTQAGLARGGEVVARKSAYTKPYFQQPEAKDLVGWKDLVLQRGQSVTYPVNYTAFGTAVSNAMTRMVLQNGSPAAAAAEIMKSYAG